MAKRKKANKYEILASDVAKLIESGALGPGASLPSVRQMSAQNQVSVTTVLQAYDLLESQGLIEAKPRSGFYVRMSLAAATLEPELSTPEPDPSKVSVRELVTRVMLHDALDPELVHLGAAYPPAQFSAISQLNRNLASAIRRLGDESAQYDLPPGNRQLRQQIARRSVHMRCNLRPRELVLTNGCTEAVSLCLRAVCQPGDTVAIESPICFDHLQCLESLGLNALEIPTHPRDGISLDALSFAIQTTEVQACLVISNYNNPLGSCMPDENKKELVRLLAAREIPLIENDIFGDLHFGDQRPTVAKAYDKEGLVMLCSSFSKTLALGYRVGWVSPGRYQDRLEWLKYTSSLANNTVASYAVADFLKSGGYRRHLLRIRMAYNRNLTAMRQAIIRGFPNDIRVTRPMGGFLLWIQLPSGADALELYKLALKDGIAIIPGHIFSASDQYRNFIRLNAATWGKETERAIYRLGQLCTELA